MKPPTFLSLFSGVGALDLGLARAGWNCIGQVEVDPFCRAVLEKHWPDVPRYTDVRTFDPSTFRAVDLVAGGFPCQPHSVAGKRKAQADSRHLWPDFARIVRSIRPTWVFGENVPGIRITAADEVLGDLEAEGYACWSGVVGAEHVRAPHKRHRVWIIGRLADTIGRHCCCGMSESIGIAQRGITADGTGDSCESNIRSSSLAYSVRSDSGPRIIGGQPISDGRGFRGDAGWCGEAGRSNGGIDTSGHGPALDDAAGQGRTGRGLYSRSRADRGGASNANWSGSLADSKQFRRERRQGDSVGGERDGEDAGRVESDDQFAASGPGMGNAQRHGLRTSRRSDAKITDQRCIQPLWPSRPGEPQADWEAPRLIEFPLGGTIDGLTVRLVRFANRNALKAYGNAVVWIIPYLIGQWMLEQHRQEVAA